MTAPQPSEKAVKDLIANIKTLSEFLPVSVPLASAEDKIYQVMTGEASVSEDMHTSAKELLDFYFEQYKSSSPQAPTPTVQDQLTEEDDFLASIIRRASASAASQAVVGEPLSEIERYAQLNHGIHQRDALKNPLLWWKSHQHEFPVISRMARDFLAIPGAIVSVERLFSKSRHLCADERSSFKAKTLTLAMCTKEWIREGLMKWNAAM